MTSQIAPTATGFGFHRQMSNADFAAFRRWHDARSLLLAARADREAAATGAAGRTAPAATAPMAEAA